MRIDNDLKRKLIIIAIGIIILLSLFWAFKGLFGGRTLKSPNEYFKITYPKKYSLIENTEYQIGELSVYDGKYEFYVYTYIYELSENVDIVDAINEDYNNAKNKSNSKNFSAIEETKIRGLKAYYYSYNFTGENNIDSYVFIGWIKGKNDLYLFAFDVNSLYQDEISKDIFKIFKSFKALK